MTLVAMATVQGPSDEGPTQAGQRDGTGLSRHSSCGTAGPPGGSGLLRPGFCISPQDRLRERRGCRFNLSRVFLRFHGQHDAVRAAVFLLRA